MEEILTKDSMCCDREMAKNEDNENCEFRGKESFGSWYGGCVFNYDFEMVLFVIFT